MRRCVLIGLLFAVALPAAAVERPLHTYSIVARDPATGDLGVAVHSHWFSVGSIVTWAEAGVGAGARGRVVDDGSEPVQGAHEVRQQRAVGLLPAQPGVDAGGAAGVPEDCAPAAAGVFTKRIVSSLA